MFYNEVIALLLARLLFLVLVVQFQEQLENDVLFLRMEKNDVFFLLNRLFLLQTVVFHIQGRLALVQVHFLFFFLQAFLFFSHILLIICDIVWKDFESELPV